MVVVHLEVDLQVEEVLQWAEVVVAVAEEGKSCCWYFFICID